MRKFAYIRVSTEDQSYDRQLQVFKEHGIVIDEDRIKEEKVSGKSLSGRDVLDELLNVQLKKGDILYVTEFSRLARSVQDLLSIVDILREKGVTLVSIKESLDTNTSHGRMILTILGAVAEFERNIIRERQAEGIRAAKERGVYKGRKKVVRHDFPFWYESYMNRAVSVTSICNVLKISRTTFYRMVDEYEKEHGIERNRTDSVGFDVEKAKSDADKLLDSFVTVDKIIKDFKQTNKE